MENKNRGKRGMSTFFSSLLGAVIGGVLVFALTSYTSKKYTSASNSSSGNEVNITTTDDVSMESAVVKKSIDSVVGITTKTETTQNTVFGSETGYTEGVGSGSIVTSDGYILTNSHVVSDGDAEEISVLFNDGESVAAKLVWNDTTLDLAVIKVDKTGLNPIEFGDSDSVGVGDRVVAIGNPLGLQLQSTVTSGIISGLNRTVSFETGATMDGLMQTDAAINSGNSGGALLNAKGELIGINTAKAGNSDGIGFAIPSNIAKKIVDQIAKTGEFKSVYLGITGSDLSLVTQSSNVDTDSLGTDTGVLVRSVYDDDLETIKEGDIITAIDDTEVTDMSSLKKALLNYYVGDSAKITLYRDGKKMTVNFKFTLDSSSIEAYKDANPSNQENTENQNNSNSQDNSNGQNNSNNQQVPNTNGN